ncbi:hypothetical protein MKW98_025958 [Papaver atlanticum]|uniref:Uncharacterized protein n=1 Tax=Papaver atlanticum TaxID=357466 RepID=A0AAD4SMF7_9MAGN|nr:hypothetical protein MKW98_025958 [Papaver atlanticum]
MTLPVKFMNQHRNKRNLTFGLIAGKPKFSFTNFLERIRFILGLGVGYPTTSTAFVALDSEVQKHRWPANVITVATNVLIESG